MPKISIIIPIYNSQNYLHQCLDSILNQTLKDIEIILVDDGSIDKSCNICLFYEQKDNRIKFIKQKHCGAATCRNIGFKNSTGKYVLFFDSDDIMELDTLEKLYNRALLTDADITMCHSKDFIQGHSNFKKLSYALDTSILNEKKIFCPKEIKNKLFQFCNGWAWDKLYKSEFIKTEHLSFQNLRHSNDLSFVFSSIACAKKITYIDDICVYHRRHQNSLETTRDQAPECFYYALLNLKKILEEKSLYETYEKSFVNFCLKFSMWHLSTLQNKKEARKLLKKLLKELNFSKFKISDMHNYSYYLDAMNLYHPIIMTLKRTLFFIGISL